MLGSLGRVKILRPTCPTIKWRRDAVYANCRKCRTRFTW